MKDIKVGNFIKVKRPFGSETIIITEILSTATNISGKGKNKAREPLTIKFKFWSSRSNDLIEGSWFSNHPDKLQIKSFLCSFTLLS